MIEIDWVVAISLFLVSGSFTGWLTKVKRFVTVTSMLVGLKEEKHATRRIGLVHFAQVPGNFLSLISFRFLVMSILL